jgi:hypothetical protein
LNRQMRILSKKDFLRLVSNYFLPSRSQNRKQHSLGFLQDIVIADPVHLKSLLLLEFCESELYPRLFFWRRNQSPRSPSRRLSWFDQLAPHPSPLPKERELVVRGATAGTLAMAFPGESFDSSGGVAAIDPSPGAGRCDPTGNSVPDCLIAVRGPRQRCERKRRTR